MSSAKLHFLLSAPSPFVTLTLTSFHVFTKGFDFHHQEQLKKKKKCHIQEGPVAQDCNSQNDRSLITRGSAD